MAGSDRGFRARVYHATKQAATVAEAAREVAEEAAERERGTAASLRNRIDELRREVGLHMLSRLRHALRVRPPKRPVMPARQAAEREQAAAQEAAERKGCGS